MSDNMTILIVGAGSMALSYTKVLQSMGIEVVVVGRGETSAARFESVSGITVVRGGLHCLPVHVRKNIYAAIVATNIDNLASVSTDIALMGIKRLLIEKPAGTDVAEIRKLTQCLSALECSAYVAYNRRFYASVRKVRDIIENDGGVSSFHFEFTEIEDRVLSVPLSEKVLQNLTLGNSSHVVDLAFFLCGKPHVSVGGISGSLSWHPSASVFAGVGRTVNKTLFTWRADWSSAGRWCIDIRTRHRRLLLEPLEGLMVQEKGSFNFQSVELDDRDDRDFKPGLKRQTEEFLSLCPEETDLISLSDHCRALDEVYIPIFSPNRSEVSV